MEQIPKDLVLAAVVRTFFQYFTVGVLEPQTGAHSADRYEPRSVKQALLNHYGQIGQTFNNEAFYSIFMMNYEEAEVEPVLSKAAAAGTSPMDLMRIACRSEAFYQAMVSEYKRNFEQLLCGQIATTDSYSEGYTRCPQAGEMSVDRAEMIINRMAANAYECGRKIATAQQ